MTGGQAGASQWLSLRWEGGEVMCPLCDCTHTVCVTPVYTDMFIYTSTGKEYLYNVLDSPASEVHPLDCPEGDEPVRLGKMDSPR